MNSETFYRELFGAEIRNLAHQAALFVLVFTTSAAAQRFSDQTAAAGINHVQTTAALSAGVAANTFMTGGVAAGDFDNDGFTDLVFTRLNDVDILYRNLGNGQFSPQTAAAGFQVPTLTNGVASGDIDNDGDLDLYMTSTGGTRNYLYLNNGSGVFTDAGADRTAALSNGVIRQGQGVSFGDYDNDGWLDLITGDGLLDIAIASDFDTSQLFWNNGDGTFLDGTLAAGVGTDRNGMGSTFGDYDGDGDLDWFITNITPDPNAPPNPFGGWNRLYRNDGNRQFTDVTQEAGVRDSRWSWGTSFIDYDNDSDLDLIATNGFTGIGFAEDRTFLWRNDDGVFTDVSDAEGITDTQQGRGLVHFDYDNDGDLDVVIVNNEAQPILYRNDSDDTNSFLRVDLEGTLSNRDGIGGWISVTPDLSDPDRRLVWEVDGGSSFLSQNEHTAHFGLGDLEGNVDLVQVEWSSGLIQQLFDVSVDQTISILETDQAAAADYNQNGIVDAADFTIWRDLLGSNDPLADGDGNGIVGMEDYYIWRTQFGRTVPGAIVREPESHLLMMFGVGALMFVFRRRQL